MARALPESLHTSRKGLVFNVNSCLKKKRKNSTAIKHGEIKRGTWKNDIS